MGFEFTPGDEKRIECEGLSVDKVLMQLEAFRKGAACKRLARSCSLGDGIRFVPAQDEERLVRICEEAASEGRVTKFVPASGAATRMFKDWYACLEGSCPESDVGTFFSTLGLYPFFQELKKAAFRGGVDLGSIIGERNIKEALRLVLTPVGLNYGSLPKALIYFHRYPDCSRTSLEEHLAEGALYACDSRKISRIHFTVSPEHETAVKGFLDTKAPLYEELYGIKYLLSLSTQDCSTNTITVDLDNNPVRDGNGSLVFRPGGHGALLRNLNSIDGDIIFIKNIDNVVKDSLKPLTVKYKKLLGGYLVETQRQVFDLLDQLSENGPRPGLLTAGEELCRGRLNISMPCGWNELRPDEKRDLLIKLMDRPIRVCGMVRNLGEPGGGPFWVKTADGGESLQIVEEAQVDLGSDDQRCAWQGSTYFNPVDLVCGVRDYRGRKFDLGRFADPDDYFISVKTLENREVKALELPGLWNGSMAFWNTIFIEVPIETFNPVKEVRDLLRPSHLN